MREVICAPSISPGVLETLGLNDKEQVTWAEDPRGFDGVLEPGYILSKQISDPRDQCKSPPRLKLEEAFPTGMLVLDECGEMTTGGIIGLPDGGIRGIDFTHYCLGPLIDVDINCHTGTHVSNGFCPISFYREVH